MTTSNRKRVFGDKISFKSLSCAPVNELGVVYLFGVLHDTFDFRIESQLSQERKMCNIL